MRRRRRRRRISRLLLDRNQVPATSLTEKDGAVEGVVVVVVNQRGASVVSR